VQAAKFEFVINLRTAKLLGIEVPPPSPTMSSSRIVLLRRNGPHLCRFSAAVMTA
jgi:hypothetical protein